MASNNEGKHHRDARGIKRFKASKEEEEEKVRTPTRNRILTTSCEPLGGQKPLIQPKNIVSVGTESFLTPENNTCEVTIASSPPQLRDTGDESQQHEETPTMEDDDGDEKRSRLLMPLFCPSPVSSLNHATGDDLLSLSNDSLGNAGLGLSDMTNQHNRATSRIRLRPRISPSLFFQRRTEDLSDCMSEVSFDGAGEEMPQMIHPEDGSSVASMSFDSSSQQKLPSPQRLPPLHEHNIIQRPIGFQRMFSPCSSPVQRPVPRHNANIISFAQSPTQPPIIPTLDCPSATSHTQPLFRLRASSAFQPTNEN